MIIILNSDLEEYVPIQNHSFINDAAKQLSVNRLSIHKPMNLGDSTYQRGFLDMISTAYSNHIPLSIAPHDIWYMLMTEMAKIIKSNTNACQSLFTRTTGSEKTNIIINTDNNDFVSNMDQFEEELIKLVPVDVSLFIPTFSTETKASRLATLAAFMDGVQNYYSYGIMLCGIPSVKIRGRIEDWQLARDRFKTIADMFANVKISMLKWYTRVDVILNNIISSLEGNDRIDWWQRIFTQTKIGSGGQLQIDGWIIDLYYDQKPGLIDTFGYSWVVVPFKNMSEPNIDYRSIHAPFLATRDADGFIQCDYTDTTVIVDKNVKNTEPPKIQITSIKITPREFYLNGEEI